MSIKRHTGAIFKDMNIVLVLVWVLGLCIVGWMVVQLPAWLRSKAMLKLAKDYGLEYQSSKTIPPELLKVEEWIPGIIWPEHRMFGTVFGHKIDIRDIHHHKGGRGIGRTTTVLVDGELIALRKRWFLTSTVSTRRIRAFLETLA